MSPRIGVLAVQGDVREHRAAVEALGAQSVAVRKPEHLAGVEGLIIPGGESTTIGMLIRSNELEQPIRRAVADGLPVMGTCAGMILLSHEILDGRADQLHLDAIDMTVRRNAFGRQVASFEGDIEMTVMSEPLRAVFIRAPWVERIGAGVEVLGRVRIPDGTDRIVAVRQRRALALSFHPEVTDDDRVHAYFLSMVEESR